MTRGGGWMSPTQSHCERTECTHGGVLGSEPPWRRLVTYSGVSALLVTFFTSLHPQITCRHCSKFSVVFMSIWTSQNSSTVSSLVAFDSHCRHVGKLPGSYSSTVSVGWIRLYHVSVHSPTCLHRLSSRQTRVAPVVLAVQSSAVVNHTREHVDIPEYTEHFRVYTDFGNQGATNVA